MPGGPTSHPRVIREVIHESSTTATPARGGRGLPVRLGAVSTRSFRPTANPARRVAAVVMGALARLWLGRSSWPGTPTVVWHALLIPVVVSMAQAGQWLVTVALVGAIVAAIGAVVLARGSSED